MNKRLIFTMMISVLAYILSVFSCSAEEKNVYELFNNACSLYEKSKYDEAIKEYEKILKKGQVSGNLFYNLGNCYFKKGQLGMAILNYERAKRLIPRDADLRTNYDYALSKMEGGDLPVGGNMVTRKLIYIYSFLTIDGVLILCSSIYLACVLLILLSVVFQSIRKISVIIIISLVCFSLPSVFVLYNKYEGMNHDAIVLDKICDAKFEPFDEATTYFQLNEGNKVRIEKDKDNWTKVRRQDGKSGWIKDTALVVI